MHYRTLVGITAVALAASLTVAPSAQAQAWNYPSFQAPRTVPREFNFGVADGGNAGTSLLFQWREAMDAKNHLGLDVGLADPDGNNNSVFFLGGHFGHQILESSPSTPLDLMFVAGINYAHMDAPSGFPKPHLIRIPVGVSLGHRFPLEGGMAITPYGSPRLMIEKCSNCGNNDTKFNLNVELGADWQFNPQLSGRLGIELDGSDFLQDDAFGISLAWHPLGH